MAVPNLESLLVTVSLLGGLAGAAFALPENHDRRLHRSAGETDPKVSSRVTISQNLTDSGESQSLRSGSIALHLNQRPKDITKGFVFGSDPRSCDVLLANNKDTGISANHFSIHIDWVTRDPIIKCLSGHGLLVRINGTRTASNLSKNVWQRSKSGTTMNVHINQRLRLVLSSPTRGDQQAAYDRCLNDYFLEYKNAVPELANISLHDLEVTPLILPRCPGLDGREYCTTGRIKTGDFDYDTKVFLYDAKCRPTPNAVVTPQEVAVNNTEQPNYSSHDMGKPPAALCIVPRRQ